MVRNGDASITKCSVLDGFRPGPEAATPPSATIQWLIEHHHLPALQRWEVRSAVLHGRPVRNPALKAAARELAAAIITRQLRIGRAARVAGWALVVEGVAFLGMGIIILAWVNIAAGFIPILFSAAYSVMGAMYLRMLHRGPERARQLNELPATRWRDPAQFPRTEPHSSAASRGCSASAATRRMTRSAAPMSARRPIDREYRSEPYGPGAAAEASET